MSLRWAKLLGSTLLVFAIGACDPPPEVWSNGVHGELDFRGARSPLASPGVFAFTVERSSTTYDECGFFEFDECETVETTPLDASNAEVSVLPEGLAEVVEVETGSGGKLRIQVAAIGEGEARLSVRANGFFDEFPIELAAPAEIRPVTAHGEWERPARILTGAAIDLDFVLLDHEGRRLTSSSPPLAEVEEGPGELAQSADDSQRHRFRASEPGVGSIGVRYDPAGFTDSLPFEVVGEQSVSRVEIKQVGEFPWSDEFSVTCNVGEHFGYLIDLRDGEDHAILGGGERFASSNPDVASVGSSPQHDCDFRMTSDDVTQEDCLEDDGFYIVCESSGTASVSASFGAAQARVQLEVR